MKETKQDSRIWLDPEREHTETEVELVMYCYQCSREEARAILSVKVSRVKLAEVRGMLDAALLEERERRTGRKTPVPSWLVTLCVVVFAFRGSIRYPMRPRVEALVLEPVTATNAPVVRRTLVPQLRPGVRFVPDSDSGAESTRKSARWPKSGVFSGDKEVDPNF